MIKKFIIGLTLVGASFATYAACSTSTMSYGGKFVSCTTCCYNGNCTTTCN